MKVGLVGNGGREHAIARSLCKHADTKLFVAAHGNNTGIIEIAMDYQQVDLNNLAAVTDFFTKAQVDVVVVGPEATLMMGIIDQLRQVEIPAVGPTKAQARLEGDKSFMRQLLHEQLGWGSPTWQTVTSLDEAKRFMDKVGRIVVKPLGLTGGKGVRVMGIQLDDRQDALEYIEIVFNIDQIVLLEACVIGEEFSRMAFVSDGVLATIPVLQDFKYAYDDDLGLMTGGMGAYSFADGKMPFLLREDYQQADQLLAEVIQALQDKTDQSYRGFLYGQFMASNKGIQLIEFNVRLGDPEALNLMAILASDAPDLFLDIASGQLTPDDVRFFPMASVSKYLVPNDYPEPVNHQPIFRLDEKAVEQAGLSLIHASVEKCGEDQWLALGSRTIGLVGLGDHPGDISDQIEAFLESHPIPELRHRQDVGDRRIIEQKIQHMKQVRNQG
jgi:phosphoribosylamine---glycine ligase